MAQLPPDAFTQFCWMRYCAPPSVMLYLAPLAAVDSEPKVQAHLSAFSLPRVSYQALRSGSEIASSLSCAMIDAMPSAPALPFGPVVCASHAVGQRSGLPTNAYLMSEPPMVPWLCQPQYCVQKPLDALTSAEVSTKYRPLASLGRRPLEMALDTTVWICASGSAVPCEQLSV